MIWTEWYEIKAPKKKVKLSAGEDLQEVMKFIVLPILNLINFK